MRSITTDKYVDKIAWHAGTQPGGPASPSFRSQGIAGGPGLLFGHEEEDIWGENPDPRNTKKKKKKKRLLYTPPEIPF